MAWIHKVGPYSLVRKIQGLARHSERENNGHETERTEEVRTENVGDEFDGAVNEVGHDSAG